MSVEWYFEPWSKNGDSPASSNRTQLAGVGLPSEQLFVREVVQNSTDAADPEIDKESIDLRISQMSLSGKSKVSFLQSLDMNRDGPGVEKGLFSLEDGPLPLMLIEDFNTIGLGGREESGYRESPEDNFVRLCRNVGDSIDDPENARGGSFGFGKSVYWVNSSCWTVVFYSRFKSTGRTGGTSRRLMAVGWYDAYHEGDDERRFTGRAWYGNIDGDYVSPLVDEQADEMALRLGIPARDNGELGTSILIIGNKLKDQTKLREGVELYWWPRLCSRDLNVEFYDDGRLAPAPIPDKNPLLTDYVRSWEIVNDDTLQCADNEMRKKILYKKRRLGTSAIVAKVSEEDENAVEYVESEEENIPNSIALIRSPQMVVQYLQSKKMGPIFSGVFVASDEIDTVLRRSEPPAHSKWDSKSNKITESSEKKTVYKTMRKVRAFVNDFLRSKQTPPADIPESCKSLGAELGFLLKSKFSDHPPIETEKRPVQIEFLNGPKHTEIKGVNYVHAQVRVGLNEANVEDGEQYLIVLKPDLRMLSDEHSVSRDTHPVMIRRGNHFEIDSDLFELAPGDQPQSLEIESLPLPDELLRWQLDIECEVEKVNG